MNVATAFFLGFSPMLAWYVAAAVAGSRTKRELGASSPADSAREVRTWRRRYRTSGVAAFAVGLTLMFGAYAATDWTGALSVGWLGLVGIAVMILLGSVVAATSNVAFLQAALGLGLRNPRDSAASPPSPME